jgi:hypothetical protein
MEKDQRHIEHLEAIRDIYQKGAEHSLKSSKGSKRDALLGALTMGVFGSASIGTGIWLAAREGNAIGGAGFISVGIFGLGVGYTDARLSLDAARFTNEVLTTFYEKMAADNQQRIDIIESQQTE